MPISGVIVRFDPRGAGPDRALVRAVDHVEVGVEAAHALSAVVDAPDYARHDAAIEALGALPGVCAVDLVSHDFSDVSQFDGQPRGRRHRDKETHGTP